MLSFMLSLPFTLQAFYAGITINVIFDNTWTHGWTVTLSSIAQ